MSPCLAEDSTAVTRIQAAMKVKRESSKLVKPCYRGIPPPTNLVVPLSVFDAVTYNNHVAVIYVFRDPAPPNSKLEMGLAVALSEYREFAGRLQADSDGKGVAILLNDGGVRFVEASADCTIEEAFAEFSTSPALLDLHPDLHGPEELAQVQLTRFACGSLAVGFSAHHTVADGHSTGKFFVAWGKATRGLSMDPLPLCIRSSGIFAPRNPPIVEFDHRGFEFRSKKKNSHLNAVGAKSGNEGADVLAIEEEVIVHRACFTLDFLAKLKARTSCSARGEMTAGTPDRRPYSTFQCLLAHIWRVVTRARELGDHETTQVRISVNGRGRMRPPVPEEFFGNLVLWAFPRAKVKDLLAQPLGYAAGLIRDATARMNDAYFRSFVDFASSGTVEAEALTPSADPTEVLMAPNLEVDSWLGLPFSELDFGEGAPFMFMPGYLPVEGMVFLLPSIAGDGTVDAYVGLLRRNLPTFRKLSHALNA